MPANGIALIDKPAGFTSHDVVAKLRGVLRTKKVGHAGTLDPEATGLLVIGVGQGTKLMTYLSGASKSYLAKVLLGQSTTTDDAQGKVLESADKSEIQNVDQAQLEKTVETFMGRQMQLPSKVSAKKIDGKKAYELVREGKEFELEPVEIEITKLEMTNFNKNEFIEFDLEVDCSSGTFIRALARDIGNSLGIGGHLTGLRRTRVGGFSVEGATEIQSAEPMSMLKAAKEILPIREVSDSEANDISFGRSLASESEHEFLGLVHGDRLIAIASGGDKLSPKTVFND
jgi:tRNA pseudouridine55 synthase